MMTTETALIVGPWLTTAESGWAWNEGPCPCGGILRWAEAGHGPWHRTCDRCGAHWEMSPLCLYIDRASRTVCVPVERPAGSLADHPQHEPDHLDVCDSCGDCVTDLDAGFCPSLQGMGCECGGHWRRRRRCRQYVENVAMARQVYVLIRPEHLTAEAVAHGAIYGGWARRARPA